MPHIQFRFCLGSGEGHFEHFDGVLPLGGEADGGADHARNLFNRLGRAGLFALRDRDRHGEARDASALVDDGFTARRDFVFRLDVFAFHLAHGLFDGDVRGRPHGHPRHAGSRQRDWFAGLFGADGFADDDAAFGVVGFVEPFDLAEIEFGADAHDGQAGADGAVEHVLGLAGEFLFHAAPEIHVLAGGAHGGVFVGGFVGEQPALLVGDGDIAIGEAGDGGADELADADDLVGFEAGAAPQGEHDGRAGGLVLFRREQAVAGHDEEYARRQHAFDRGDGAFQFALQGALVVDLLGEFGQPELGLFKQLEAGGGLAGQTRRGQQQAAAVHIRSRDVDRVAAIAELYIDFRFFQLLARLGRVRKRHAGDKQAVVGAPGGIEDAADGRKRHQQRENDADFLVDSEVAPDRSHLAKQQ